MRARCCAAVATCARVTLANALVPRLLARARTKTELMAA